ncbi:MAG: GxxExxY protein [Candidatus Omnitrophica bacterium]|nr:GxxExxY protein [Candidatus Omnitrophota bacterium]
MLYEELTYGIRGACYEVYNTLGPGFKEDVYHKALAKELKLRELPFVEKKRIQVPYKGQTVGIYEPDFLIADKVVVEIKATPTMPKLFETQLYYYLKGTPYRVGLLVNFGGESLEIKRRIYDSARTRMALPKNPRESASYIRGHPRLQGQSMIEYAALIAVTVAALVGMSVYMKRALNGKWRQVGDTFGFGRQYERCVTLINGAKEPGC